ncbi:unnamed protein product [Colias eurytheme]|nr:unnamed protein product [Colias eurytheme]
MVGGSKLMRRQTCGVWTDAGRSRRNPLMWNTIPTTNGFEADASADVKYLPQTHKSPLLHDGGRIRRYIR